MIVDCRMPAETIGGRSDANLDAEMTIVGWGKSMSAALLVGWLLSGCAATPGPASPSTVHTVHYVRIDQVVSPWELTVNVGDEIRWVNLTPSTVTVFLGADIPRVSCQSGLRETYSVTKIQPDDYASLCLAQPGLFGYAVTVETSDPRVVHNAVIRVSGDIVHAL
jgi:plastocyanin